MVSRSESDQERALLWGAIQPLVRSLMRRYYQDMPDLEGEIYLRFCGLVDRFDGTRGVPVIPYLVASLPPSIYAWCRGQWRRARHEASVDLCVLDNIPDHESDPTRAWQAAIFQEEALEALPDALARLPARQQEALRGYYLEGRSYQEVAAAMRIDPGTVRGLVRHGIQGLRIAFHQQGLL